MKLMIASCMYVFIFIFFVIDGFGISTEFKLSLIILLHLPLAIFLMILALGKKTTVRLPRNLAILCIVWFLLFFLSSLRAANKQEAFEQLAIYVVYEWMAVMAWIWRQELKAHLLSFLSILGAFFATAFYLIVYILPRITPSFHYLPHTDIQYFYPSIQTHNPIGLLVVIFLSFLVPYILFTRSKKALMVALYILPALILSLSRTSYVALIVTTGLALLWYFQERHHQKKIIAFFGGIIGLLLFLTAISSIPAESIKTEPAQSIVKTLQGNIGLAKYYSKSVANGRNYYFQHSWYAISREPLLGYGPGNFSQMSERFIGTLYGLADASHNIFLEFGVAGGIFASVLFIYLVLYIVTTQKDAFRIHGSVIDRALLMAFLAFILVYSYDNIYRQISHVLLFFFLTGLLYKEKRTIQVSIYPLAAIAVMLFIYGQMIIMSAIFIKSGQYQAAKIVYPLNQNVYQSILAQAEFEKDVPTIDSTVKQSMLFFPGDYVMLYTAATTYDSVGAKEHALEYYGKAYQAQQFMNFDQAKRMYLLKKELFGEEEAQRFFRQHVADYRRFVARAGDWWLKYYLSEMERFCGEEGVECGP